MKHDNKMKVNLHLLFITSFLLTSNSSIIAQSRIISGRIIDGSSQALALANVVLVNNADSTFIQGTVTKNDGTFSIHTYNKNNLLKVSCIGFSTRYIEVRKENMGDIQLLPESHLLGEVMVKGSRPQFKMGNDGIIVNVQNSLLKQAGTADDVLSQLPRISGSNGNYVVFGKGKPAIYINNRKIISPSELSQIKSADIKEIELITNPGAQYGGSVQAVISIRTLMKQGDGWSLSSYSFGNFSRIFSKKQSLSLKYNHNQLELSGNLSVQSLHNKQYSEFEQIMLGINTIYETGKDTIFNNGDKQIRGQFCFNYDIGKNHSFGLSYGITGSIHDVVHSASTLGFKLDNTAQENIRMASDFTSYHIPDHELDAYYTVKTGNLHINFNGTYYHSKQTHTQEKEEYSSLSGRQLINVDNATSNQMLAGKIVFTCPLLKGKLNFGSEYTDAQSIGSNKNAQHLFDDSHSKIKERNIAGFADYTIPLGNFKAHAGLRYEDVISNYYTENVRHDKPSRKYSDWFPNISLSWTKDKWQALISYSTKTARPSYRNLSNWMQYDNKYEYQGGNPLLRPSIIHSAELVATRNWLSLAIGFKNARNHTAYVMKPYKGNIFIKTYENIDNIKTTYVSLTASPRIGIYQPMYEISFSRQSIYDDTYSQSCLNNRPMISLRMNNRFAIGRDLIVSVNLAFHSSYASTISVYKEGGNLDLNINKSFFKKKLTCYIWGRDLLHTQTRRYTMYGLKSKFSIKQDMDTRCLSIGVQYNINTTRSKYKGIGAGKEEKDRL